MPQPQLVIPNFVQETCPAPAPGDSGDLMLDGAVAPFLAFDSQLNDGDLVPYVAGDGTSLEIAVGTFRTGPARIERPTGPDTDLRYWTTNGGKGGALVNFLGGTLNVLSGMPAQWVVNLLGAPQDQGIPVRVGEHDYATRQLLSSVPFLAWTNPSGVAGNPELSLVYELLRRSGGSVAERTMADVLRYAAPHLEIANGSFPWAIAGEAGLSDLALRITRFGVQDYDADLFINGAAQRILTALDIGGTIALPYAPAESDASFPEGNTELQTETTVSITVPNDGHTYYLRVEGRIAVNTSGTANPTVQGVIYEKIGAAAAAPKATDSRIDALTGANPVNRTLKPLYTPAVAATPGETYQFYLQFAGNAVLAATGSWKHWISAELKRAPTP